MEVPFSNRNKKTRLRSSQDKNSRGINNARNIVYEVQDPGTSDLVVGAGEDEDQEQILAVQSSAVQKPPVQKVHEPASEQGSNELTGAKKSEPSFLHNLIAAFAAQGISLILSVVMSLVIPKFLGVLEYSYWQLFIFYAGYVGFFHFGFNDGIYLRLGGKRIDQLDARQLATEFRIFVILESLLAIVFSLGVLVFVSDPNRQLILAVTALYMVINNSSLFFGYIFQAVNDTRIYSRSVIVDRVSVLVFMIGLLIFGATSYVPFILTYTLAKCISLVYCMTKGREFVFAGNINLKSALAEMWTNTKVGINLTLANIASMLILGIGRMVIDSAWGIETFGKISLSLTITNFFLLFIQQVSMVLFPALRRIEPAQLKSLFISLQDGLSIVLPAILVCYIPVKMILSLWLPQYAESLRYLALLLPICVFDGKMQMLYNTYLKVLRKEKTLFWINALSCGLSLILCSLFGFVFKNLLGVILCMMGCIAFRSIFAQYLLGRYMNLSFDFISFLEAGFVAVFIFTAWNFGNLAGLLTDIVLYVLYLAVSWKKVKVLGGILANRLKKAPSAA